MFLGGSLVITFVLVVLWVVQAVIEMVLPVFKMPPCRRFNGTPKRLSGLVVVVVVL